MDRKMKSFILQQMKDHKTMTVATLRGDGWPQATTVTYVSDGLNLYFGCDPDSQKVRNIAQCNRISAAIDHDEEDWNRIKGLSMAATAEVLSDPQEIDYALTLLGRKFPALAEAGKPDPSEIAVVKLVPKVVSVIDYEKGLGHTDLMEV